MQRQASWAAARYHRAVAAAGSAGRVARTGRPSGVRRQNNTQTSSRKPSRGGNMSKGQSLQDPFLNALRRESDPVSIYLVNGIKLQGTIESFDQFVVLLRNTVSQMVYKHAISTVVPARNVRVGATPATASDEASADEGSDEAE